MRRTKIVCTIGPASDHPDILRAMMHAGMDGARVNFSHGSGREQSERIARIRAVAESIGRTIAVIGDLAGPKLRTGALSRESVVLRAGDPFILTVKPVPGDWRAVSIASPDLTNAVKPGDTILLSDGTIELTVEHVGDGDVATRVRVGGLLGAHKGINVPGRSLAIDAFTTKDREDLTAAVEQRLDWIALSFVRHVEDVRTARAWMDRAGHRIPVIAKIEQREAIAAISAISDESDGLMVARGDLGVETALEDVPFYQKTVIANALSRGIPVITATQMLESMVDAPRPTRAEATDVATAVLDGTDALMLSEETATGKYPVDAVRTMARIAERADREIDEARFLRREADTPAEAVSRAACALAAEIRASAILVPADDGTEPNQVSAYRPRQPVLAPTGDPRVAARLAITWGVVPVIHAADRRTPWFRRGVDHAKASGILLSGDCYVAVRPPDREQAGAIEVAYA
ncbi:MAG TPA: pyruvate kinase [Nitrospiria bacterium]|nr:pyruvate kinase [Nitrospiria bacterium]